MFASQAEAYPQSERLVDSEQNLHNQEWCCMFTDEETHLLQKNEANYIFI